MKQLAITAFTLCLLVSPGYSQQMIEMFSNYQEQEQQRRVPFTRNYIAVATTYQFSAPMGSMNTGMSPVHSLQLSGDVPLSFISPQLQVGLDASYGLYGYRSFAIKYRQNDNYINTSVNYSSSTAHGGVHARYLFLPQTRFQPFVTARAGYMGLFSSFVVSDPMDFDACRPLDDETFQNDGTLYWGYGAGFRWNVGANTEAKRHFIEFSVTHTRGNNIEYVNVNHLHDHSEPLTPSKGSKPVDITFVNASNQNIHQHRIAEVFTNPLNMLQFQVGYTVYLRTKRR